MKKLLIIILLSCSQHLIFAQANIYHTFPDSSAVWSVVNCGSSGCLTYHYCVKGDTIINSITYHKLSYSDSLGNPGSLIGGIREANKKIFFICLNSIQCVLHPEQVLYNFNAIIGDTIQYALYGGASGNWTVQSIDSIQLLDGKYRKKFNIDVAFCMPGYVIEGIGNANDLLYGCYTGGPGSYELLCFKQNKTLLYLGPTFNTCYYNTVSTQEYTASSAKIIIYPNPIVEFGNITLSNLPNNFSYKIEVYNYLGSKVKESFYNENMYSILKKDFTPGFYVFKIVNEQKRIYGTGKFIIQ
jgi:hypothetical protein